MLEVFKTDAKIGAVGGEILTLKVDPNNLVEIFCQAFDLTAFPGATAICRR
jgi:hypothetical protein